MIFPFASCLPTERKMEGANTSAPSTCWPGLARASEPGTGDGVAGDDSRALCVPPAGLTVRRMAAGGSSALPASQGASVSFLQAPRGRPCNSPPAGCVSPVTGVGVSSLLSTRGGAGTSAALGPLRGLRSWDCWGCWAMWQIPPTPRMQARSWVAAGPLLTQSRGVGWGLGGGGGHQGRPTSRPV